MKSPFTRLLDDHTSFQGSAMSEVPDLTNFSTKLSRVFKHKRFSHLLWDQSGSNTLSEYNVVLYLNLISYIAVLVSSFTTTKSIEYGVGEF